MDNIMEKFYVREKFFQRIFSSQQIKAVNAISKKIHFALNTSNIENIGLGPDWKMIKKEAEAFYLQSSSLNLVAKISLITIKDKKYFALYLEKNWQMDFNLKTKKDEKVFFDVNKTSLKDWFSSSEIQVSIPCEMLTKANTQKKTKEELLKILEKRGSNSNSYIKSLSPESLEDYISILNLNTSTIGTYEFNSNHQMFSLLSSMLGVEVSTQDIFQVSAAEQNKLKENNQGKKLNICFDYLYYSLNLLGAIGEENAINFNDCDNDIYLLSVAGKKVMCTKSQNGGWITVKGNKPGSWQCYGFTAPFSTPIELMKLGPTIIKPSLEIKNYEITSFDLWLSYCQYSVFNAIAEVQECLEAKALVPPLNVNIGAEEFMLKKIEEDDIRIEKQRIEKSLSSSLPINQNSQKALKI